MSMEGRGAMARTTVGDGGGTRAVRSPVDGLVRSAGIVVFVLGILLLVTVFYEAYTELQNSGVLGSPPPANLSTVLLVVAKGLCLLVMGYAGSAISNKGIGLYQAAIRGHGEV